MTAYHRRKIISYGDSYDDTSTAYLSQVHPPASHPCPPLSHYCPSLLHLARCNGKTNNSSNNKYNRCRLPQQQPQLRDGGSDNGNDNGNIQERQHQDYDDIPHVYPTQASELIASIVSLSQLCTQPPNASSTSHPRCVHVPSVPHALSMSHPYPVQVLVHVPTASCPPRAAHGPLSRVAPIGFMEGEGQ